MPLIKTAATAGYRFILDGRHVKKTDTPASVGCEDGDTIDAMVSSVLPHPLPSVCIFSC